jgi:DNA-binding response OmpR family regulator
VHRGENGDPTNSLSLGKVELVLVDLSLPDGEGLLVRQLRKELPYLKILATSVPHILKCCS